MSTKAQQAREEELTTGESDLPEGWAAAQMGDLSDVVGGGTPATSIRENFSHDGHAWLTPADLSGFDGIYINKGSRCISEIGLQSCSAKVMPKGTVLMSSRAPIGYVAVAANPIATNQGFKSFVLANGIVPEYCFFWLKYKNDDLQELGSGTTFLEISGSRAKEIPVAFPPTPEQQRISDALKQLTSETKSPLNHLARARALLANFRQSVLVAACSGKLTEDIRQSEPLENHEIKSSDCDAEHWPKIPQTWSFRTVDSVSSIVVDCPHSTPKWTENGIVCLRTTNFQPGFLDLESVRFVSEITYNQRVSRLVPAPGDVLYSREGGILGIACLFPSDLKACLGQRMMLMRADAATIFPAFLMHVLNSPFTLAKVQALTTGSASPHLNVGEIKAFAVPTPPLVEQKEIVRRVEALFKLADVIEKRVAAATARAENLTQAVLAKAFRGELVPTEAELARREGRDYEPASVLLERIRREKKKTSARTSVRAKKVQGEIE